MTLSSYAYYEDAKKFKKQYIPVELAKELLDVLPADYWDIMALAGVEQIEQDGEILKSPAAEARERRIAERAQQVQLVTMQVALPSEAALAQMFEGLLLPLDRNLSTAELARMLAQRLPTAFAQLRDLLPETSAPGAPGRGGGPRSPAKDRPESPQ